MNETPKQAARRLAASAIREGYKPEALHEYRDANNNIVYHRIRLKHPDGRKWIRPMRLNGKGYELSEPEFIDGKPLYHLPHIVKRLDDAVWFVEGELCADALTRRGLLATTSGGADSAMHTDFSPLVNRCVIIWPDNDESGLRHAREVADKLVALGATVRLVDIDQLNLPLKADVVDWLKEHPNATNAELHRLPLVDYAKVNTNLNPAIDEKSEGKGKSQATRLIELAETVELFHDANGKSYATLKVSGHKEAWPIRSKGFRDWLCHQFYRAKRRAPSNSSLQDALMTIEGQARYDGAEQSIHLRIAAHNGSIYIDLCDPKWRVVEISTRGWKVIPESPVHFVRAPGMHALSEPVAGDIKMLIDYLNITEHDRCLVLAWLVAAMRPTGPYPVLILQGEQGTAKSTAAKVLRSLVDPSAAPLRTISRDERDLMIAAKNGWMIALDNLSGLSPWLSDALCRIATGGGFATRELYSDTDEVLIDVQRPIVLNGIDDITTRQDLIDRSIIINLEPIPDNKRKCEAEFWDAFENDKPALLGALLERVSRALCEFPNTHLDKPPRMADFAKWATAAEPQDEKGAFIEAYRGNRAAAIAAGLEGSPVASALQAMISAYKEWEGTATELLLALPAHADVRTQSVRSWPKSAKDLGSQLRRLATALRIVGIEIVFPTSHAKGRKLRIFASQPSFASQYQQEQPSKRDATRDASSGRDANGSVASPCISKEWDARDAKLHPFSNRNRPQWTQPDFETIPNPPEGIAWHDQYPPNSTTIDSGSWSTRI